MITEQQYLNALDIVNKYAKQVEQQINDGIKHNTDAIQKAIDKAELEKIKKQVANMTIDEIFESSDTNSILRVMPVRLYNCLKAFSSTVMYPSNYFYNKKLCDIQKREFLKLRNVGLYSWFCLCDITGNTP